MPITVLVKSTGMGDKGKAAGKPIITVDGKAFGSEYPITIGPVPADALPRLKVGTTVELVLARGGLRSNKAGEAYNGSQVWMYYWNWAGFAGEGADAPFGAETAQAPTMTPTAAEGEKTPQRATQAAATGWREAYAQSEECKILERTSIERQKALDLALQWANKHETDTYHVLLTAQKFTYFLKTGTIPPEMQPKKPAEGA